MKNTKYIGLCVFVYLYIMYIKHNLFLYMYKSNKSPNTAFPPQHTNVPDARGCKAICKANDQPHN